MSLQNMHGYLAIILHAHLPFVRHPEYEDFLEEDWLYEALTETYLPLLDGFRRLQRSGIPLRLTMTLSPTLVSMLTDRLLVDRYVHRLDRLCELAEKECRRLKGDSQGLNLSTFYLERFHHLKELFLVDAGRDLVGAFGQLQRDGALEIITCGATHALLPLYQRHPQSIRAQVAVAARHYRETFGASPRGIWLPECAYFPGLDAFLADEGIRYFIVDTHGILQATPRPRYGVYAPVITPSGPAAFGRDADSSQQVWSADCGYPGDVWYREFYRDIGYDLDLDYIRPYIQPTGDRKNTGIKYHRITDRRSQDKAPYDRDRAMERARCHAADFVGKKRDQIQWLASHMDGRPPIVVAPYDAELFGHWWFEGPDFLENVIRDVALTQSVFQLATPSDYLAENPVNQEATPPMCTWGAGGYVDVWVDESNDWIYRHVFKATERMTQLADMFPDVQGVRLRALNQAARELMLAQASDWAFIMKAGTMAGYAVQRTRTHLLRFTRIYDQLLADQVDERWLGSVESMDNLFPRIDYRVYRTRPQ